MTTTSIDHYQDLIDVRDIIARFEELENDPQLDKDTTISDEANELAALLDELKGNGGDEQWRGAWYPVTLIRDSYFKDYAMELADDLGAINSEATWPNDCIDWDRAADELQMDYSSLDYNGIDYWYR